MVLVDNRVFILYHIYNYYNFIVREIGSSTMKLMLTEKEMTDRIVACGIRPSLQRIHIYRYLCTTSAHPTAESVYSALVTEIPTLSRTTVYNTLKLFHQHKLVETITIENEELRYDADTSDHLHFKCNCCGHVSDVPYEETSKIYKTFARKLPAGFSLSKIQTCIWGTCAQCTVEEA